MGLKILKFAIVTIALLVGTVYIMAAGPAYWHEYVIGDFDPAKPLSYELQPNPSGYGPINPHGEDYMERAWPHSPTYFTVIQSG